MRLTSPPLFYLRMLGPIKCNWSQLSAQNSVEILACEAPCMLARLYMRALR